MFFHDGGDAYRLGGLGVVISGETAWIRNVRLPPEGLCGFEPPHLPQATGFAGGSGDSKFAKFLIDCQIKCGIKALG